MCIYSVPPYAHVYIKCVFFFGRVIQDYHGSCCWLWFILFWGNFLPYTFIFFAFQFLQHKSPHPLKLIHYITHHMVMIVYQAHLVLDDNTHGSECLLQFNGLFESWIGSVLWIMFTILHFFSVNYVTSAIGEAVIRVIRVIVLLLIVKEKGKEKNERRGCKLFKF